MVQISKKREKSIRQIVSESVTMVLHQLVIDNYMVAEESETMGKFNSLIMKGTLFN